MSYAHVCSLFVLTLLQLCRATPQSSKQPDEWFSANIGANDGYSPQSIAELFSTMTSPITQPIVVVPSSTSSPLEYDDVSSVTVSTKFTSTVEASPSPFSSTSTLISSSNPTQSSSFTPGTQFISSSSPRQLAPTQVQFQQPPSIVFPDLSPPLVVRQPVIFAAQNQTSFVNQPNVPIQNVVTNTPSSPQSTVRTTLAQSPQTTVTIQPRPQNTATFITPSSVPTKSVTVTNPSSQGPFPAMQIRVRAPAGSVTKIKFVSSTTKRPTTRTTRTPKARNNYNSCINICGGRRDPICATPLSRQINADNLKGFPSVCHMACHNSFKSDRYEKVVDGKCGKLRTHIRTLGSKKKLKKEELQKTQYTLVQNNNAVVEFESLVQ